MYSHIIIHVHDHVYVHNYVRIMLLAALLQPVQHSLYYIIVHYNML